MKDDESLGMLLGKLVVKPGVVAIQSLRMPFRSRVLHVLGMVSYYEPIVIQRVPCIAKKKAQNKVSAYWKSAQTLSSPFAQNRAGHRWERTRQGGNYLCANKVWTSAAFFAVGR
eukprot:2662495-Amphidinium_carterae.1